jgi:hypothetical protein
MGLTADDFEAVNAAIPIAIADHYENNPGPPSLPSYDFSYRTMTS